MAHGGTCTHDHDCSANDCDASWSLFQHVDIPKVRALNEAVEGSAKKVFKSWGQRLDFSTCVESNDDDPELLIFIPFTSDVKLKSISIIGGTDGTTPARMRAFINRDDIDFSVAQDVSPVQEWQLGENNRGELEYPTRVTKFQGVSDLTLHFPEAMGSGTTRIHYIGLRGEASQFTRQPVTNIIYEAMPNPHDHKLPSETGTPQIL
eukprot:jgi/Mesen1/6221/ME000320S05413